MNTLITIRARNLALMSSREANFGSIFNYDVNDKNIVNKEKNKKNVYNKFFKKILNDVQYLKKYKNYKILVDVSILDFADKKSFNCQEIIISFEFIITFYFICAV